MSPRVLRLAAVYPQDPAVVVEIALPPPQNLARSQSHRQRHHRAQSQPVLIARIADKRLDPISLRG